jgi:hypothetical protein
MGFAVKIPGVSIGTMMLVVVVVALNLAAFRRIESLNRARQSSIVSSGLLLQLGIFRLLRCNSHVRPFWTGFVSASGLAFASLVLPESRYSTTWYEYFLMVGESIRFLPSLSHLVRTDYRVLELVIAPVVLLPLLVISLSVGLLTMWVARVVEDA